MNSRTINAHAGLAYSRSQKAVQIVPEINCSWVRVMVVVDVHWRKVSYISDPSAGAEESKDQNRMNSKGL